MKCPGCNGEGIRPGPSLCPRCRGVGIRARESEARIVCDCAACGAGYDAAAWASLQYRGPMTDGAGGQLEIRICSTPTCKNTISLPLVAA